MSGVLLDVDQYAGMTTRTLLEDGKIIQKREWDERPLLDANKAAFNDAPGRFEKKPNFQRVASLDMGAYYEIVVTKMGIPPHRMFQLDKDEKKRFRRYLNDPEYRGLRTSPGRI